MCTLYGQKHDQTCLDTKIEKKKFFAKTRLDMSRHVQKCLDMSSLYRHVQTCPDTCLHTKIDKNNFFAKTRLDMSRHVQKCPDMSSVSRHVQTCLHMAVT